jgi:hypothetical protein
VIDGRSQFLDAFRVLAAALATNPHTREWGPQIVGNVGAGADHALHERFDDGQSVERMVDPSDR